MARKTRAVFTSDNKKSIANFKKIKKQYLPWTTRKNIDNIKEKKKNDLSQAKEYSRVYKALQAL